MTDIYYCRKVRAIAAVESEGSMEEANGARWE